MAEGERYRPDLVGKVEAILESDAFTEVLGDILGRTGGAGAAAA